MHHTNPIYNNIWVVNSVGAVIELLILMGNFVVKFVYLTVFLVRYG